MELSLSVPVLKTIATVQSNLHKFEATFTNIDDYTISDPAITLEIDETYQFTPTNGFIISANRVFTMSIGGTSYDMNKFIVMPSGGQLCIVQAGAVETLTFQYLLF